ncbi:MAG: hypothetical protein JOZ99_06615 [Actinobacteria bacterium]|nr:hypothetical protein [Actinomycetota bacterium]
MVLPFGAIGAVGAVAVGAVAIGAVAIGVVLRIMSRQAVSRPRWRIRARWATLS